jgi:purine-cytosine permease-like protein
MGTLINFLVLMVLLFTGLAQTESLPKRPAWAIAVGLAVVTFALAIVRYRRSR